MAHIPDDFVKIIIVILLILLLCLIISAADKILTGEMSVTITTRTLCELNEAVDNLQDGLSPPHLSLDMKDGRPTGRQASDLEEWNFYLQLVLDIVSKAPVLVVSRPNHPPSSP